MVTTSILCAKLIKITQVMIVIIPDEINNNIHNIFNVSPQ